MLSRLAQSGLADAMDPFGQAVEVHGDLAAVGDGKLPGLAGREGPPVGGEVGQGDVDLVADGRDDGQAGAGDGPRHDLLVERPEILGRPAAARDDDQVGVRHPVGQDDRGGDLGAGPRPLHPRRRDQDLGGRPPPAGHLEQVADGRPGRAGDDHDPPGEPRQRPLPLRVEQALGTEPGVELPEGQLLGAEPFRLEMADDDLVFPPGRIDRQSPEHPHGQAVGRSKASRWASLFHITARSDAVLSRRLK